MQSRTILATILTFLLCATSCAAAPKVLATLKPVHSLAASVMQGVGEPELLIGGALSEHSYQLKPSDAGKLRRADLIFEIGPDMETYLIGPLKALGRRVVVLERVPGVKLQPARRGGLWGEDEDDRGPTDPHIWLDPHNAVAMTHAMAAALVRQDPANAATYRRNEAATVTMLEALDRELAAKLAPVRQRPYLVFHDAYHYFEARYGLHPAGAVTVSPEHPVGTRRVAELRDAVQAGRVVCMFREPQFPPKLIETLDEAARARVGVLDPLGAGLQPGPALYPRLMRDLAQSLSGCLGKKG